MRCRFSSVDWLGVSTVDTNTFSFWLVHTVMEDGLARLLFEEWLLLRQYT